jgi:transposase
LPRRAGWVSRVLRCCAQYQRLAAQRGRKRALVAVELSILVIDYHLIKNQEVYRELGGDYFDQHSPQKATSRLVRRLERLGYQVNLERTVPMSA